MDRLKKRIASKQQKANVSATGQSGTSQSGTNQGGTNQSGTIAGIQLTKSDLIKTWQPTSFKPLFNRTLMMQLIGKTTPIETTRSALMRCYLSNGEDVFRMAIWFDHMDATWDHLRLGNVLHITNLKCGTFFEDPAHKEHSSLWSGCEFTYTRESKITVKREVAEQFISNVNYPPFWKTLSELKEDDKFIAMRVLLLDQAVSRNQDDAKGVSFTIGDSNLKKATCFLECDAESKSDKEVLKELKKGTELLIGSLKVDASGTNLRISVESCEYVTVVDTAMKKLEAKEPSHYKSIPVKEIVLDQPAAKRRSFF